MSDKISIVVTSINKANNCLKELVRGCNDRDYSFIVIGDSKSPSCIELNGCDYYNLERQKKLDFEFVKLCPENSYSRKNIGYLIAARKSYVIIETDDDNIPYQNFWDRRILALKRNTILDVGWTNVYRYFTNEIVWPRGFPLEHIKSSFIKDSTLEEITCPIQQNMVNGDFDVDAIYRFTHCNSGNLSIGNGIAIKGFCPFNSQNTAWFSEVFKLMYLPSYCSSRVSDIWRSFIAQIIMHYKGWFVLYDSPNMMHIRNEHNLMDDFQQEVVGYLNNAKIVELLYDLSLTGNLDNDLNICYEELVSKNFLKKEELTLLNAWLKDFSKGE